MKNLEFELVCDIEVDSRYALEVLDANVQEILGAIQLQISRGRDPHVFFTDDSGKQSLFYHVGERDYMLRSGLPAFANVDYFATAMPMDCETATKLKAMLVESGNTILLSPCHA